MAPPKMTFQGVAADNRQLSEEMRTVVDQANASQAQPPDRTGVQEAMARLYSSMCRFAAYRGQPSCPDKTILAAWYSFLAPIEQLGQLTRLDGHLLAARMLLYLTSAFAGQAHLTDNFPEAPSSARPIAARCDFLLALDDALLTRLAQIWARSNGRDCCDWAFSEYPVFGDDEAERRRSASLTSRRDMTPANGVEGRTVWMRPRGDLAHYERDPKARGYWYKDTHPDDPDRNQRLLMSQTMGSDGPLRIDYIYNLIDQDTGHSLTRFRPALRRSLQFLLDARRLAVRRQVEHLLQARYTLPAELQAYIWDYVEATEPKDHSSEPILCRYLSRLDLAAVYKPFPEHGQPCKDCPLPSKAKTQADKLKSLTCPQKSIVVWNLPLRVFHTFHPNAKGSLSLCVLDDCPGHHTTTVDWQRADADLETVLNAIIQARCGPATTLETIGLGPVQQIKAGSREEDEDRSDRLFSSHKSNEDLVREHMWAGLRGLSAQMRSGKVLVGSWESGKTTTDSSWCLGRTRSDEVKAISTLRSSDW